MIFNSSKAKTLIKPPRFRKTSEVWIDASTKIPAAGIKIMELVKERF